MPANPAIVADDDRLGVLDVLAAALHFGLVRGVHDGDVGAEHDRVADGDQAAVEDREVEIGVEAVVFRRRWLAFGRCIPRLRGLPPLAASHGSLFVYFLPIAQTDVAPVVDSEGRFDDRLFSHVAQQLFQFGEALLRHGFERRIGVFGEGGVVFMAPAASLEADAGEFGDRGVVAGGVVVDQWSRSTEGVCIALCDVEGHSQHARNHLLVLVACGDVVELASEG